MTAQVCLSQRPGAPSLKCNPLGGWHPAFCFHGSAEPDFCGRLAPRCRTACCPEDEVYFPFRSGQLEIGQTRHPPAPAPKTPLPFALAEGSSDGVLTSLPCGSRPEYNLPDLFRFSAILTLTLAWPEGRQEAETERRKESLYSLNIFVAPLSSFLCVCVCLSHSL